MNRHHVTAQTVGDGVDPFEHMLTPEEWVKGALCGQTDPEAFFPIKGGSTKAAKEICARCDVSAQCLEYSLRTNQTAGIWGGLSERERSKLRKARTAA